MQNGKKSKKDSIEKLRNILDNTSYKDLPPEDAKYLKDLSRRLGESSKEEVIYTKTAPKKREDEEDSLKPKVTVYPRERKKIIEFTEVEEKSEDVTFTDVSEDVKELSYEEEDVIEVEKVEVTGPEFIEVKPKEEKKIDEEESKDKKAIADEGLSEWEPVEAEPEEVEEIIEEKSETVEEEFVPVFEPVKKAEEKEDIQDEFEQVEGVEPDVEKEVKIEVFKDLKSIDDRTAVLLYDNGFTTVEAIENATQKDLTKIKGIKRKTAKNIKKEIEQKNEWVHADIDEIEEEKLDEFEHIAPGETAEGEITEEQIEHEEDTIDKEVKIDVFKDFESIDDETAVLLYDNGFTTANFLMEAALKDLIKIKGLKRKTAKNIKKEIDSKIEESAEVKDIEMGETAEGDLKEEQIEEEEVVEKEKDLPSPVELSAESAEWKPTTEEDMMEQEISEEIVELEEPEIEKEVKIEVFKDLKSIDDDTAVLLYDNGFTTVEAIENATQKDLTKIKGIKRKTAKNIKKEIEQKNEWLPEDIDDDFIEEEPEIDEAEKVDEKILDHEPEPEIPEEDVFKDIKSINEKIAKLLKNNGINSIDALKNATIKDLIKIKGVRKKIAKEIKKEVNELTKEDVEKPYERGENPFILEDEDEDQWESFDEEKASESKMKEIIGFQHGEYTLYEKEIDTKSGKTRKVRFFSKAEPEDGHPIELPKGYAVKENKKTGVPYLKRKIKKK
jgi:DNA integrity scanning protein DisA with diadenylate cyclase activity